MEEEEEEMEPMTNTPQDQKGTYRSNTFTICAAIILVILYSQSRRQQRNGQKR